MNERIDYRKVRTAAGLLPKIFGGRYICKLDEMILQDSICKVSPDIGSLHGLAGRQALDGDGPDRNITHNNYDIDPRL